MRVFTFSIGYNNKVDKHPARAPIKGHTSTQKSWKNRKTRGGKRLKFFQKLKEKLPGQQSLIDSSKFSLDAIC